MIRRLDPRRWDAPTLVAAVLAIVVGLQIAWLITDRFGAHETPQFEIPATGIVSTTSTPDSAADETFAAIRRAALFGDPAPSDPNAVNPTSLPLQLAGVLAERDPARGQALIGESGSPPRVYAVGAALPAGASLQAVYPDRVLIDRGGVTESLALPRRTLAPLPGPTPPAPANPAAASPGDLGALLRWQVVVRPGQTAGLRVYPGNDARIFAELGLRAGDLVLAINDVPLEDPANAEQFLRTLTGAPESTLTVERDGREERLSVNLTRALAAPLT